MEGQKDNLIMRVQGVLHKISKWVSYTGMAMAIIMMLMVVVDVVMRFAFDKPILGTVELASYMLSVIAFTAIPLVESEEMHIVIPLMFDRLPKKMRLLLNTIVSLIGLGLLITLSLACFQLAFAYFHRGKVTQVLSIPLYPFVFIAACCITLYAVILVLNCIKFIYLEE